jgi:hypothetical protein
VLLNIVIGCAMVIVTTAVHAACMVAALRMLRMTHAERWGPVSSWTRLSLVSVLVLIMFGAGVIEAALWSAVYLAVGAISGLEPALYFSMVTYTTLGYGDVVLEEQWRLLGSFEAANGIIIFGWTTALIVAAVHKLYFTRQQAQ